MKKETWVGCDRCGIPCPSVHPVNDTKYKRLCNQCEDYVVNYADCKEALEAK